MSSFELIVFETHCSLFHSMSGFSAKIFLNPFFYKIYYGRENNGHTEFINIIHQANSQYQLPAPPPADLKCDKKYNETIHQLGN